MKKIMVAIVAALGILAALPAPASATGIPQFVTICHAAGLEGTTKFVTLTLPYDAVFGHNGESGHLNENGTTKAGHEQDYLGECNTPPPTDVCPNIEGDQETIPDGLVKDEQGNCVEVQPPPPGCTNGEEPIHGKDGGTGNDACDPCAPPVNLEKCPAPEEPPVVVPPTEPPVVEPPVVTPPEVTPPAVIPPKAKPPKAQPKPKPEAPESTPVPPKTPPVKAEETLPYTGLPIGIPIAAGSLLSLLGLGLRRRYPSS